MTISDQPMTLSLARWARRLDLQSVPEAANEAMRRAVADTLAVAIAGSRSDVAVRSLDLAAGAGPGSGRLLDGRRSSIAKAAFALGTASHALDFDDTCFAGIVHGSAVIVPAAFAAAMARNKSGLELQHAVLAGSEVCYALGDTLGPALYHDGWFPTGVLGGIGAATAVGLLFDLEESALAAAIALSAVQASGLRVVAGSAAKPYLVGRAAEMGLEAALAAEVGIGAPSDALEGRNGLFSQFGDPNTPRTGRGGAPGHPWRSVSPGLVIKASPLCSCAQAAVDAVRIVVGELGAVVNDIENIDCRVAPMVSDTLRYDRPATLDQALFSLPFALAIAVLDGTVRPGAIDNARLDDPVVGALMTRISSRTDSTVTNVETYPEAAEVSVRLKDGRAATHLCEVAAGDPRNPLSTTAFDQKLRDCLSPMLGADRAEIVMAQLADLQRLTDLNELWRQLSGPVSGTEKQNA